jgi:spoIIIJ-associated protein
MTGDVAGPGQPQAKTASGEPDLARNPDSLNGIGLGPAPGPPTEAELVRQEVQYLVDHIGVRGRVEVEKRPEGWYANIRTRRPSHVLVGRHGATLEAIGHLVRLMVLKHYPNAPHVLVDAGGYRRRRANFLRAKASAVARLVLESGREMELEPATYEEMAVIQDELKSIPGVRARAVGDGHQRDIIISPARK